MYVEKWSTFTLDVEDLEAAKKDQVLPCPHHVLGTVGRDHVSIELPTFQRGLVWTPKHGEEFQRALQKGWPIGQLVLAEKPAESLPGGNGWKRNYQLIDGQQRTYWLNRTKDRFFLDGQYSLDETRVVSALHTLSTALSVTSEDVKGSIRRWTSKPSFSPRHLRDVSFLFHHLAADLEQLPVQPEDPRYEEWATAALAVNDVLAQQYEALQELDVPVLLIRQELEEDLHEIFQRLNQGTSLSDLDLLAAEWQLLKVDIGNSGLEPPVKDRLVRIAQERISGSYDQDAYEYDPDLVELKPDDMSLFDMLYALGKYAEERYPDTFEGLGKGADRLAIFVSALVFAGTISRRKELRKTYPYSPGATTVDSTTFPRHFLLACQDIHNGFTRLNAVQGGKRLRGRLGLLQAAAYIASHICLVALVDRGSKERLLLALRSSNQERRLKSDPTAILTPTQRRDLFRRRLVGWFLVDGLSEAFQGGDAYAEAAQRVWNVFDSETGTFTPNEAMLTNVDKESVATQLGLRFRKEFQVQQTPKQRRYSEPGCVALRVAYSALTQAISGEELDHVIPFDARNSAQFAIPINHPANLMLLRKTLNSGRREKFLPVYLSTGSVTEDDRKEVLTRLFVPYEQASADTLVSVDAFRTFLASRWIELSKRVVIALDHPSLQHQDEIDRFVEDAIVPLLSPADDSTQP